MKVEGERDAWHHHEDANLAVDRLLSYSHKQHEPLRGRIKVIRFPALIDGCLPVYYPPRDGFSSVFFLVAILRFGGVKRKPRSQGFTKTLTLPPPPSPHHRASDLAS